MKLNVGDTITIKQQSCTYTATVEDASKGDVIMAKVKGMAGHPLPGYEEGKVYEFSRKDIQG